MAKWDEYALDTTLSDDDTILSKDTGEGVNKRVSIGKLAEHINKKNPVPETDKTLSVSGANADAKVVGDKLKEVNTAVGKKQDKLTAGSNITINGTTISAKDTIYDDTAVKKSIAENADSISKLSNEIDGLENSAFEFVSINPDYVSGYCYTLVTNALFKADYYRYTVISAENIKEVSVTAQTNKHIPPVVFMKDKEIKAENVTGYDKCGSEGNDLSIVTNYTVTIPSDCKYILFQSSTENFTGTDIKQKTIKKTTNLYCKISDGILTAITPFKKTSLKIEFGKRGVNNIPDFRYIHIGNTAIYSNTTDWHSPFVVGAVNNADGDATDKTWHFTGGNHSYANTGEGVPTGRCTELEYYVDGVVVEDFDGYCSIVDINWTNLVQGYNTKKSDGTGREILREEHRLHYDGYEWKSEVYITPLEDIKMGKWYGFQCAFAKDVMSDIRYIGGTNRGANPWLADSNCGDKECNMLVAYGNTVRFEMEIDKDFDLGSRKLYSGTEGIFGTQYGNAYCYFASNANMSKDDVYAIRGYYRFSPM